ncbi:MAG: hypothetical protein Q8K63_01560 [Acidimicrobiales bacterium]|nr:hypothetical protein [Acidimicrobiales bacterium]
MGRLGMRVAIVLVLAAVFCAVGAPANAWSTSVTRTPRFDFGCQLEVYASGTPSDERCSRTSKQARDGFLRSRVIPSVDLNSLSLLSSKVGTSSLSDSTGVIFNVPAPAKVAVTVVARGVPAASGVSPLQLCVRIVSRIGDEFNAGCQPMAVAAPTTTTADFDGVSLDASGSPYRVVVSLEGTGRANVRSINYRLEGAPVR